MEKDPRGSFFFMCASWQSCSGFVLNRTNNRVCTATHGSAGAGSRSFVHEAAFGTFVRTAHTAPGPEGRVKMNKSEVCSRSAVWFAALLFSALIGACGGGDDAKILGGPGVLGPAAGAGAGVPGPAGPAPALGAVQRFGTFGGSAGMTNDGLGTTITGTGGNTADIGTTAVGPTSITGFHDSAPSDIYTDTPNNQGNVTGKIYTCTNSTTGPTSGGVNAASCALATQARADA